MSRTMLRARWIALLTVCALALPAAAQAAPTWLRVADNAPGETLEYYDGLPILDMAIAESTPYLATESLTGNLTVWRPNAAGSKWIQAGSTLNHVPLRFEPPFRRGDFFAIAASGATPWVAWTEKAGEVDTQVHVARLEGTTFQEPVAATEAANWPRSASADSIDIVVFGGRPYVTMGSDITRTTSGGDAVEHITGGLPSGCRPAPVVSSGRLYTPCGTELLRLNGAGSAWEHVATNGEEFRLVDVTGTLHLVGVDDLYRLESDGQLDEVHQDFSTYGMSHAGFEGILYAGTGGDSPGPDVQGPVRLFGLYAWWWAAPSPGQIKEGANGVRLLEGPDGNLWMLWHANVHPSIYPPRYVHVARFAEQDTPFAFAPDPGSGGTSGGEPETPAPTPSPGGGFTTPDGTPVTPGGGDEPAELLPGACANTLVGTAGGDRLVGSRLGDRIFGRLGDDHLFGRAGSDCVWGGPGDDFVSGGAGADLLNAGRGDDRLVLGSGRDGVAAGPGNDSIHAVGGGVDRVNCGAGRDTVRLSRNDLIKGCERVIVTR
jgi:hypothetical protein